MAVFNTRFLKQTECENLLNNAYAKKADREIFGAEAIKKESAFLCSLLLLFKVSTKVVLEQKYE